ncbi:galactoside 2-alpha-L-fucosyltransferase Sec1 [Parasteatoda tepidariorum]|uniref:galactoside 2-alpha-L-fucosyltransferase Sec1 n=1 Tax=Parasteatoda tepidariorum TaxID=114398 RepID=UPI00077F8DA8|nr:galactoside 2-alpha-L-fucosyltransferase Sec1 [Parasteatoda tepidariorum]
MSVPKLPLLLNGCSRSRSRRNKIIVICIFLISVFLYYNSNAGDLVSFFILSDSKALPLSIQCNLGRLGNQMCTYATLYGLSKLNRRTFIPLSCNLKHLKPYFQQLSHRESIHQYLYIKWQSWPILSYFQAQDAAISSHSNFIKGYKYPCSYTFFDHIQDELREQFRFTEELREHAYKVLHTANVNRTNNVTYVGVHVRRGDYQNRWLNEFGGVAVNMEFFQKAADYFRDKYSPVIFILISDDREWCIKNLSERFGFHVAGEASTPAHDLSVLAHCNHTIMTYGTFGFWGAYLAGGEVLYFDKFLKPNTSFTNNRFIFNKMYPPRWKGLATVNSSIFNDITFQE